MRSARSGCWGQRIAVISALPRGDRAGREGRLYVVLPTGVETTLPFACNAPSSKTRRVSRSRDPETSPTNRWLLNRAGNQPPAP